LINIDIPPLVVFQPRSSTPTDEGSIPSGGAKKWQTAQVSGRDLYPRIGPRLGCTAGIVTQVCYHKFKTLRGPRGGGNDDEARANPIPFELSVVSV